MKTNHFIKCAAAAAALVAAGQPVRAQDNYIVNAFDSEDEVLQWVHWWGNADTVMEWDPTVDADGNANSGSMKVTINFDLAAYGNENQFAVRHDLDEAIDGTKYTNMVMSIRFDPSSPARPYGDFGYLEYGVRHTDWSSDFFGNTSVSTNNTSWVNLEAPIPLTHTLIDDVKGVCFKMWAGGATDGLTGTTVFWVDNIHFNANTNVAPPPPPTMAVARATPGLQLYASKGGSQYQRQSLRTMNPAYGWMDAGKPVTYSMTIKEFPDSAHSSFQAHIFLVPGDNVARTDASPDYSQANVVFVQIVNQSDGSASASFLYKTNQPSGNSMFWNTDPAKGGVGNLATITNATTIGTWSVTLSNNAITLKTPSGTSTNFTMPAEAAALFAGPGYAYFGVQPNQLANIGQSAIFSRIQIEGTDVTIDEEFLGSQLLPDTWEYAAEDVAGIVLVPKALWISWTLPAVGYTVQSALSLASDAWQTLDFTNIVQVADRRQVLLPMADATNAVQFYRVVKAESAPTGGN